MREGVSRGATQKSHVELLVPRCRPFAVNVSLNLSKISRVTEVMESAFLLQMDVDKRAWGADTGWPLVCVAQALAPHGQGAREWRGGAPSLLCEDTESHLSQRAKELSQSRGALCPQSPHPGGTLPVQGSPLTVTQAEGVGGSWSTALPPSPGSVAELTQGHMEAGQKPESQPAGLMFPVRWAVPGGRTLTWALGLLC